jgi:serine/threonine-protein kinase
MPWSKFLEERFEEVLADFLQAEERGERPDQSALLRAHPELEVPLREFFRDRDRFDRLAPTVRHGVVPPAPEPAPVRHFGNYAVLEEVGQGGRGIVYRVSDPELNRPLAVKVLRAAVMDEPDAVRRFLEEAQVMGQLQHPGIVPVHAVGRLPDGRPYFVMKLVQGRTLAQLLAQLPCPAHDLPRFLVIFQQVCQAVAYAHSRGVIHRDLKPANIMVGAFGEIQVMDWGLAKVLKVGVDRGSWMEDRRSTLLDPPSSILDPPSPDSDSGPGRSIGPGVRGSDTLRTVRTEAAGLSSADGLVVGTFAYMAPEQANGRVEELDPRADVFGLGAVLCEVLTGLPPYAGASPSEMRLRAATGDLAEAFARLDGCGADAELIALARDCLAPGRQGRPTDAAAVAERLTTYLAATQERLRRAEVEKAAAHARAEEARATVRAERRARRLTVGLAAALLAVVLSLTVGGLWFQRQQAEAARQAEALRREVGTALAQAIHLRQGAHYTEGHALLEQAQQRLGSDGPADLREQVEQALADTRLARRLDETRQLAFSVWGGRKRGDFAGIEKEYAAALAEAGLGQFGDDAALVAARVQASAVRPEVVAALDDWASIAWDEPRRAWLLAVARAADPDPERDRLRQPKLWRDGAALARLAAKARVAEISPQLVTALGRALIVSGHDSIPLLRKAQAYYPDDFWLNFALAWALNEARHPDQSIGYYRAALALRPEAGVHNNLGVVLDKNGQRDEAVGHYEKALRINPRYARAHCNLAIALRASGRVEAAMGHYEQALRLDPGDAVTHYNFAIALCARGRLDEGISHYEQALRLDPTDAKIHFNLGIALNDKGKFDAAISHYKEALHINPKLAEAHSGWGVALYAQGRVDEAIGHYEEALRRHPRLAHAHHNLAVALTDKGKFDAAISHYQEALRINPRFADAHHNLGLALRARGRVDEAISHFEKAVRIKPRYAAAHHNLGNTLCTRGRLSEAIGHLEEALRLDPKIAAAQIGLGGILYLKGRLEETVHHSKEALRLDPRAAEAYVNLVEALLALGRFGEAQGALRRCLDGMPQRHPLRSHATKLLQRCERMLVLQDQLPAIVSGEKKPAGAAEALQFAGLCQARKEYTAAVRLFTYAFAADPRQVDNSQSAPRYFAARCAVLAAAELEPRDMEKPRLRGQSLDWLRADLALCDRQTSTKQTVSPVPVILALWTLQNNAELASVRDTKALALLPGPERKAWERLWADVEAVRQRACASK